MVMEVDRNVGLRYPYKLFVAIVGLLFGSATSLFFSWRRYQLSLVSVSQRVVELEGQLAVNEADVKRRLQFDPPPPKINFGSVLLRVLVSFTLTSCLSYM